jgi:hypothetical protein
MAVSCKYGDERTGSGATELVQILEVIGSILMPSLL